MEQSGQISYATIRHVLIVDDEIEFVKTLKRHLKRQKLILKTALDGSEAMEQISRMAREENAFDLVVSDVLMPHMDGIELLENIKRKYPATSVLLLTGFGENAMADGTIRKEMDDFHQKPITPKKMLSILAQIDRRRTIALKKKGWGPTEKTDRAKNVETEMGDCNE